MVTYDPLCTDVRAGWPTGLSTMLNGAGSTDVKYPDHGGPVKCAKDTAVGDGLSIKHMSGIYQVISRVIDI